MLVCRSVTHYNLLSSCGKFVIQVLDFLAPPLCLKLDEKSLKKTIPKVIWCFVLMLFFIEITEIRLDVETRYFCFATFISNKTRT